MKARTRKTKPTNKTKKGTARKPRVIGKLLPNNRRKRANIIRGRKIAAASAANFKKRFTMLRQNGNSVRVTGRDLIYSIPDELTSPIQQTNVITVIPANPAYWKGTRIAALASGYQNYRPITFKITYIPMCAVTQQGNVIGGTIWDDGIDNDNLQQSLRTSNGGFMTQCYVPHTTIIRPKTNLQFNLYRMGGEFSTTSNPFIFIALAIGCKNSNNQRITPGYFYVTWSFELKNPIGSVNTYNNSGLIQYQNLIPEMNNVIVNIDPTSDVPFGAYMNIEQEEEELVAYYNDTPIDIAATTPVWAFTSVTKTSNAKLKRKIPIIYTSVITSLLTISTQTRGYLKVTENSYEIYIVTAPVLEEGIEYRIPQQETLYLISDVHQNFATYIDSITKTSQAYNNGSYIGDINVVFRHYTAPKTDYTITIVNKFRRPKITEAISNTQEHIRSDEAQDHITDTTQQLERISLEETQSQM